ncbi:glycosyltransferase family 4 protein [Planomonospora sp. ID67723]|uniref:glycosyltransferase family 4 protein n=1 Tax=Planomonospora sp. ID67723 TaxID=2738134 RepID=UPI0018C3973A|nr:glycosyltransferase family 4 protein [Planomonospora sp. ID67723]MBG0827443.1 glycosyltransferase family 4 protein [Planomonospora sp. ID67723]
MRLLVGLHHLELGGSQLNALDLALRMRDRGHHVALLGTHTGRPGPMADLARERGLEITLVRHPRERTRPVAPYRAAVAAELTRLVREQRFDLVHTYEYPLALDAVYGPHARLGTPLVSTVYTMRLPRWLPRNITLVAAYEEIAAAARACGQNCLLIEPPVDTDADSPQAVDGAAYRAGLGISPEEIVVGIVTRLEPEMKAEGVVRAMEAVRRLDPEIPLRLLVVGTGPSYDELAARGAEVNEALGRQAVLVPGALGDPRPAYAASDISVGMGGSAVRGMSFARPLIVIGTRGFSRTFRPDTADHFLHVGYYGVGEGIEDPDPLAGQIRELALDAGLRSELGSWSRRLVVDRYSLDAAANRLEHIYLEARTGQRRRGSELARTAVYRAVADMVPDGAKTGLRPMARRVLGQRA